MAHILIVDDQPYLKELLWEDLRNEGHRITWVAEEDEAMESIRSSRPDIVLLDLYLNGFEGWSLLSHIKNEEPRLPVLIVSAYDSYKDDSRLAQADGYVVKDIYTDQLKNRIYDTLARHGQ